MILRSPSLDSTNLRYVEGGVGACARASGFARSPSARGLTTFVRSQTSPSRLRAQAPTPPSPSYSRYYLWLGEGTESSQGAGRAVVPPALGRRDASLDPQEMISTRPVG